MKKPQAAIFALIAIIGIAVVAMLSRQSATNPTTAKTKESHPESSNVSNQNEKADYDKAVEDARASMAQKAPPEPSDVQKFLSRKLAQSGERIEPKIVLPDGSVKTPIVNEVGEMEYVYVDPEELLSVTVNYPEGEPGQKVSIATYDGGVVNDTPRKASVIPLDESKNLNFKFKAGADRGRYQIALIKGGDEKVFRVWVGPALPLARH